MLVLILLLTYGENTQYNFVVGLLRQLCFHYSYQTFDQFLNTCCSIIVSLIISKQKYPQLQKHKVNI